jgi:hypothetical protein
MVRLMIALRFLITALVCVTGALFVGGTAPAGMLEAPMATPALVAAPSALDLAAMTLTPAELGLPGAGLATHAESSRMVFVEEAFADGFDQDALDAAGWRRSYESALATQQATDSSSYQEVIVVRVTEYTDNASAAQGFNALMQDRAADGAQVDRGTTTFGDRSAVARWSGVAPDTGVSNQVGLISFQLDALTADVTVYDFTDRSPDPDFLERLAAALLAKIGVESARGNVGLGAQALRLTGQTVATDVDRYERRDGEVLPIAGETADQLAWRRNAYPQATEEYLVSQAISGGMSNYAGRLVAFQDVEAASDAVRAAPSRSIARLSDGAEVLPLLGVETFGDESLTLAFSYASDDGRTFHGFLLVARAGAVVSEVWVESEQERPPLPAAQELMHVQVDCIRSVACLDPVAALPA